MKRIAPLGLLAMLSLAPLTANALLIIDPAVTGPCGTPTCLQMTGNQTSQAQINAAISAALGTSVQLYKQNVGGGEEGSFAPFYTTTFSNSALDPEDATIVWDGPAFISDATHLLVKDGNSEPAWYLFSIAWDGKETIQLQNFWPSNGAISHVTIYGRTQYQVPEPGTLGLLGAGLLAFGFVRRRKAA